MKPDLNEKVQMNLIERGRRNDPFSTIMKKRKHIIASLTLALIGLQHNQAQSQIILQEPTSSNLKVINQYSPPHSSTSQMFTNWGNAVEGIRYSIVLTNNVLIKGSTNIVFWGAIKNTSTNDVQFTGEFHRYLIDDSGKKHDVWPYPHHLPNSGLTPTLKQGKEFNEEHKVFKINNDIDSGHYKLGFAADCFIVVSFVSQTDPSKNRIKEFRVESNLVDVQVE